MDALSIQERARRLAEYSKQIAGDAPVEAVFSDFSPDTVGLESVPQARLKQAATTVERVLHGQEVSREDLVAAEAIIHKTKRPSHLI